MSCIGEVCGCLVGTCESGRQVCPVTFFVASSTLRHATLTLHIVVASHYPKFVGTVPIDPLSRFCDHLCLLLIPHSYSFSRRWLLLQIIQINNLLIHIVAKLCGLLPDSCAWILMMVLFRFSWYFYLNKADLTILHAVSTFSLLKFQELWGWI
jgi:hypothetical protein